jgi:hypothetical protein
LTVLATTPNDFWPATDFVPLLFAAGMVIMAAELPDPAAAAVVAGA